MCSAVGAIIAATRRGAALQNTDRLLAQIDEEPGQKGLNEELGDVAHHRDETHAQAWEGACLSYRGGLVWYIACPGTAQGVVGPGDVTQ